MKLKVVLPLLAASLVFAGCTRNAKVEPSNAEVVNASVNPSVVADVNQRIDEAADKAGDALASLPKLVVLTEQSDLGQTGTATLTEESGKVKVVLDMKGGTFTAPQPAHIHIGNCPEPGAVK